MTEFSALLNRLVEEDPSVFGASISLSKLFKMNAKRILKLRDKGYTNKDLTNIFNENGINITTNYMSILIRRLEADSAKCADHRVKGVAMVSQMPTAAVLSGKAVVSVPETEVERRPISYSPNVTESTCQSSVNKITSSNQYVNSNEGEAKLNRLTFKEAQDIEQVKRDTSRSTLYPEIVFLTREDWCNAWDRSKTTALDRSRYPLQHVYLNHRAVEIVEFISPEEKKSMQEDFIHNYSKVDSGNVNFWEVLSALANPKFNGSIAVQIPGYSSPLSCRSEVMTAIRLGKVRNFGDFRKLTKELSTKESLKRGY